MKLLALRPRTGRDDGEIIQEFAIVDDEDYDELSGYVWYVKVDNANTPGKRHYSVARQSAPNSSSEFHNPGSLVVMGRHILGIDDPSILVRHKNKDPLDCRKSNLLVIVDGYLALRLRKHWLQNTRTEFIFPR